MLRLKQPMMHGSAVKRLQEMGDLLGFDYGANDGIYGPATEQVVKDLQEMFALKVDGICGPKTWKAITDALNELKTTEEKTAPEFSVIDIRDQHPNPKWYARKRLWSEIEGVTLHQTGCNMPKSAQGWCKLNAHIGVTTEGTVIIVNDPTSFIWHGQRLSRRTIGIEIEGNYEGIEGKSNTLWKGGGPAAKLTEKIKAASDIVFQWLLSEFTKNRQEWKYIYAHRQSKDTRTADPGSAIWQEIALPWIDKLGCKYDPKIKYNSGKPIPKQWDSNSSFNYY